MKCQLCNEKCSGKLVITDRIYSPPTIPVCGVCWQLEENGEHDKLAERCQENPNFRKPEKEKKK